MKIVPIAILFKKYYNLQRILCLVLRLDGHKTVVYIYPPRSSSILFIQNESRHADSDPAAPVFIQSLDPINKINF